MPNDYYNASGAPGQKSARSSSALRSEFNALAAAFAKFPAWAGNAKKSIRINAGGTALEAIDNDYGTYTPTQVAGQSNITSLTFGLVTYMRVGKAVQVGGKVLFASPASGITTFRISLPPGIALDAAVVGGGQCGVDPISAAQLVTPNYVLAQGTYIEISFTLPAGTTRDVRFLVLFTAA